MKHAVPMALVILALVSANAFAEKKNCEDLKTEIAAKLEAKGVKSETVVGSCEGGAKRIIYTRK